MAASSSSTLPHTPVRDVVGQALLAVTGRRVRSALTAAGVALGVAAAVATIGITASAAAAISGRFDALRATEVGIRYPEGMSRPPAMSAGAVRRLNGVVQAGLICHSRTDDKRTSALGPSVDAGSGAGTTLHLVAAQPQALQALGVNVTSGRAFDDGHASRHDAVAMLDTVAAHGLGVFDGTSGQLVYVDGRALSVIGIYRAPAGNPALTAAVVLPYETCLDDPTSTDASLFRPTEVAIRTRLGAADQVAEEARVAIRPTGPADLVAVVPPALDSFRRSVETQTQALFLGLAGVSLIMGALGVFNTTWMSVMERTAEIGLRRAVGASRRAVGAQFLCEAAVLGLAGGVIGTLVAVDVTAVVALLQNWLVVLPPGLVLVGPGLGLLLGVTAGWYPAWRAGKIAPATTLRR
ncbi:ABC transporter permease [Pseudonocardia sp.]|uniref:ABC transporter permease n=1 Tax=Pseudonocardia sp. TaxID=60912 RepID=UPI0031FE03D6